MRKQIYLRTPRGRCLQVEVAATFKARGKGLLGRDSLPEWQALLITPCSSIHMIGMRMPIDAVWLDRQLRVKRVDQTVPPGVHFRTCLRAHAVLEMAAGAAEGILPGDQLKPAQDVEDKVFS